MYTIYKPQRGDFVKVNVIKGPMYQETEKKLFQYLNKVLRQKANEIESIKKSS